MLIVKFVCFLSYFSEALVLQNIIWWLLPLYVNCEIRMFRKPLNNRSSRLDELVFLKSSKNSQENTCVRVPFLVTFQVKDCSFIKKRLQHRCFLVKYAKFILQDISYGIKSTQTKSFVVNNLLLYNRLIT